MYQCLLSIDQVAPIPTIFMQPPFPQWYKPDLKYEYHVDTHGHNIEMCLDFKTKVLQLIKAGCIIFNETLNVNSKPTS